MPDYYEILGVPRDATPADLKKAFRQKAQELHPDKNPDDPKAEDRFKKANEAYAVLSDPDQRKKYDQFGDERFRQAVNVEDIFRGKDFSGIFTDLGLGADLFSNLFGGAGGRRAGGRARGRGAAPRGADSYHEFLTGFREAAVGGEATVLIQGPSGTRDLTFRIPAGVRAGQKIRLRGEGAPSEYGGPAGDLYIVIQVAPHPLLTRDGDHIRAEVRVPISTLLLGGTVEVPTLEGPRKIRVPAGTPAGTEHRLRGHGAVTRAGGRGDLFAVVLPVVPDRLSDDQRAAAERLRELGL